MSYVKEMQIGNLDYVPELFGIHDDHLRLLENTLQVKISLKHGSLIIEGGKSGVDKASKIMGTIYSLVAEGHHFDLNDLKYMLRMMRQNRNPDIKSVFSEKIHIRKGFITPKSSVQLEYIKSIRGYDIVLGIGPAGTGKTYLAMAMAISGLLLKNYKRIILTRPAIEAGESLGFLPGDMYEKVNPYLRPLYDALYEMLEFDEGQKLIEKGAIEIAPLAYMRGRTLNNSFIILDEAQNTTPEQMKMFLTRLGFYSKAVITGDITQVDLPSGKKSGLIEVQGVLKEIKDIKFIFFSEKDVVRHELVQQIIKAYEKKD